MIFVRHTEECSGNPNSDGRLTGPCDCATAELGRIARSALENLIENVVAASHDAKEDYDYLMLRLSDLIDQLSESKDAIIRRIVRDLRNSTKGHFGPDCEICNSPVGCCCPEAKS